MRVIYDFISNNFRYQILSDNSLLLDSILSPLLIDINRNLFHDYVNNLVTSKVVGDYYNTPQIHTFNNNLHIRVNYEKN